ncbi:thymus-specific serine protease-like, partial [Nasonia vitripennis]|uniref:Uncharacterized protein n=1 Tax=Nasonia vitripennis TaxID=7425 RepID=A0A7M7ILG8_NASVI
RAWHLDRRWIYQVCTEFGWFHRFKKILILGVERTNLQFGGLDIADSVTNIVLVNGSNDPWHAAGVVNSTNPRSPVIYVEGAGHCPLIHPPRSADNAPLAEGKQRVEKIVDFWLKIK